jgi:Ca-activated chloride channel family protein
VESEDRLDAVMERIQQRMATPLVSGLAIRSAGLDIVPESLVPARLPNLVPGVPLVVRGRYRGRPTGGVRVEGSRPGGDAWREQAEATAVATGCQGSLWARGRLRHLEDLWATGNHDIEADVLERRLVELSTGFGVLCRFTAIVAIDPRHPDRKPDPEALRRIVQPVEVVQSCRSMPSSFDTLPPMQRDDLFIQFNRVGSVSDHWSQLDSLAAARIRAAAVLAKARPRSGAIDAVTPAKVRSLLKAVLTLLRQLGACGAPRDMIESLATAYGRLYAMPADRFAIVSMLDVLADIAGPDCPADGWWQATPADTGTHDVTY